MLTQDGIRNLFEYEPNLGVLIRRKTTGGMVAGCKVGSITKKGYCSAKVLSKSYMVHRLIWLYVYGKFPENQIDHINGIRHDNRVENLREAITHQNCSNQPVRKNNTSGARGVVVDKKTGKFTAQCNAGGIHYYLGQYATREEASRVREEFAKKMHGEFYKPLI